MLKSFLLSNWIVIVILAMIATGVAGLLTLQIENAQRERAAALYAQQLARERAQTAARINKEEQETIRKAPAFKLLRN